MDRIEEIMKILAEAETMQAELNTLKGAQSRLEDENEYLRGLVDKLAKRRQRASDEA